jgi:type II secretory pathway pseudopilin PulG
VALNKLSTHGILVSRYLFTVMNLNIRSQPTSQGFTLIELLVVAGLAIILILGATSLFYTSLISSTRQDILRAVKQEGDYSINQMEFLLRNAVRFEANPSSPTSPLCTTSMQSITIRSKDEGITTLAVVNNKIASISGSQTAYYTSDAVTLENQAPLFDCIQTGNVGGYVTIHFTLTKQNTDYSIPNTVSETFTTSVNLRTY